MSTSSILIFQQAEDYHFKFQKGMYLSERFEVQGVMVLYSDMIEDVFWNYATQIRTTPERLDSFVAEIAEFLRGKGRVPCFYLTPWTEPRKELESLLKEKQYTPQLRDAWMFFDPAIAKTSKRSNRDGYGMLTIKTVDQPEDFITVFAKAYGGESTKDEPYGGLPDYYIKALRRSFAMNRDANTFHFVAYTADRNAVAIATLVYIDGWGCIYNVGTPPESRGKGFGTTVSQACIDKWHALGGHTLFLQTEAGSKVENWYMSMGFVTKFVGEGWASAS
jgi:GNAT superfamily N-acetyltransferase